MFSIFKKEKKVPHRNLVWFSKSNKYNGLYCIINGLSANEVCIIMSSFDGNISDISTYFESKGVEINKLFSFGEVRKGAVANIFDTRQLQNIVFSQNTFGVERVKVIFLEHYPILSKDQMFMEQVQKAIPNAEIEVYLALDEPLLTRFASDRLIPLMKQIGMKEDEIIEHKMVSKSIENALKKIQKKVKYEKNADTEEDWFKRNY